jgi:uncharacterized protein YecA (UPF0149 family)
VWGDFEPVWEDEKDFTEILSLMMRHMNAIANMLTETPEEFEPVYLEREILRGQMLRGRRQIASSLVCHRPFLPCVISV